MENSALLIIDMQQDLCYDLRRKTKVDLMIAPLLKMIDFFEKENQKIYYTEFSLKPDDPQFERFGDTYCIEGTQGAEIIPELLPLKGTMMKKTKHSAFFETELDELLKNEKIEKLYLAGLQTQICIMTTAADASFRGYNAVAISDCVVSSKDEVKANALEWISKYVGSVQSTDEIISMG